MTWTSVLDWLHPVSIEALALLADATLKGSVVLLVSLVLVRRLRARSAAVRYLVLLLAILSVPAIPVLSVTLPRWAVLPARATTLTPDPVSRMAPELSADRATITVPDRPRPPGGARHPALPVAAAAVWLAGAALITLRTAVGSLRLHRLAARAEPLGGPGWTDLVRTPGWLTVELARSRVETMPMAWGVLRAHVLLPHGAATWPIETRRAVLLHEVAHLARLDPLTRTVARLAGALFWFNPLLWVALHQLGTEQEKACDDVAAARLGNAPDYAQHVLGVVAGVGRNASVAPLASALARPSALEQRMRAILDPSRPHGRVLPGTLILSVCLALAALVPVSVLAPRTDPARSASPHLDSMGRSALHLAARDGDVPRLTRLLAEGPALEAIDDEGRTPLHLAAGSGQVGAVTALLEAGSDRSARDLEGRTPLHLAARNGHPEVVRQLLAAGGSAHTRDFEGRTPFDSAAANRDPRVVELLGESDAPLARPEG